MLTGRSTSRDLYVVAWVGAYVALIWRWSIDRTSSAFFPIVWSIYTLVSLVALFFVLRDWRARRRQGMKRRESSES